MALSNRIRSSIFVTLAPIMGEEETEAMLWQFPARDLDEPVTKEFVRAEIADVRAEIADVRAEMAGFRAECAAEFAAVRVEIAQLEARMNERFREQTIWIASAMTLGMGLSAGLASVLG